ncbi:MAG TPA: flavin reductase [Pusillimonas sp.]|jgi:flavin reductase (DIM6/NTAB) family NADH-FMN oxidoreductase RutF|nr:flavin reductase [Pusillimonas sp.]|tara:strand:+ start:5719 stop:6225 length:507 start_codon:yes stop_codon:yes gene_type:complete
MSNSNDTTLNQEFRAAMRQLAGGVSVITAAHGNDRTGLTATSVVSISMNPPELFISVNQSSSSWPVIEKSGKFGINVLQQDQQIVAEHFSGKGGRKGAERYADDDWYQTPDGVWLSNRALAAFACDVDKVWMHREHALIAGLVTRIDVHAGQQPLTYWHGHYGSFVQN